MITCTATVSVVLVPAALCVEHLVAQTVYTVITLSHSLNLAAGLNHAACYLPLPLLLLFCMLPSSRLICATAVSHCIG
jgi:hypothetical protein